MPDQALDNQMPIGGANDKRADDRPKPRAISMANRVALGFSISLCTLIGIGVFSLWSLSQSIADSKWENHTYQVLAAISALRADLKDAESDTRGYVISGEQQYLDTYQVSMAAITPRLLMIKTLTADNPGQQRRLEVLKPLIDQKLAVMREKQARRLPGFEQSIQAPLVALGERLMSEVEGRIREMEAEENQLLGIRLSRTKIDATQATRLIEAGGLIALALIVLAAWWLASDIAGRSRAEAALRASDSMFRGLLESAPDAMVIVNESGAIEIFNAQAETMFGYTAAELHGQSIEMIIPLRYREGHVAKRGKYFAAPVVRGMEEGLELFGVHKNGTEIPVEISLSPLVTPLGLRVSSAIRNISRRKREIDEMRELYNALQARSTELEVANRELESFSYSVSHDLRTPLRSIDGFSQALLDDNAGKLDAESQDHLNRVRAASQKMGKLIDDLLNLARVTRTEMHRELVDVSKIAHDVVDELRGRGAAQEHDADIVVAEGLVAEADAHLLRVVLANLLSNAWKFTGRRDRRQIEFGYCARPENAGYFVRDNGAGFDMVYAEKLFGAFQRLHSTAEFPGTGIGLATVQRVVHRHGGRVWAEAAVDQGATFHFTLAPPGKNCSRVAEVLSPGS